MEGPHHCASLWKVACKQEIVPSKETVTQDRAGKLSRGLRRLELGRVLITSEGGLGITVLQNDDEVLVRLNGRTTVDSSPDLRDRLLQVLAEKPSPRTVIVDLAGVTHIEASGIATLIEALRIARHHQTILWLRGLSGSAFRLFEVTGVLALFEASNCGQKAS
jgi:anti-sigma B factor antagonist